MKKSQKFPKIITRGGDYGKTSLYSGERVEKNSDRIKALAAIDLADSHLGVLKANHAWIRDCSLFSWIQRVLINIKGDIASTTIDVADSPLCSVTEDDIFLLEDECENLREYLSLTDYVLKGWIIYGDKTTISADIDYSRALFRSAEVSIAEIKGRISDTSKIFVNRLSDYLFLLARVAE